ncbi:MAG: ArnT family glycosyltransferase [Planctomycetota bacterium]
MVSQDKNELRTAPPPFARGEIALLVLIVIAAFLLRGWAILFRGFIAYDETYYYILGRNLLTGHGYTLNGLPHATFPPLYPILAGLAGFVFADPMMATSAVSAFFGALLPLPVYFLARDIHGRRAGLFAAASAAVLPSLFFYATKGVPYAYKMYAGTETLYVTLFAAGAASIWLARKGSYRHAMLAGLFFGLAALTRSEGPVISGFILLWFLLDRLATGRRFRAKKFLQAALTAAVMLAVFSPWLLHLRKLTGQWTLGPKLTNKVVIREALWKWFKDNRNADFLKIHYRLNDDATWMQEPYWGVSDWHRTRMAQSSALSSGLSAVRNFDTRWAGTFAPFFYKQPFALLPPLAILLVCAGLFFPPWSGVRARWWGFLLFNFLVMLFMAVSVGALPRNELPLVALLCVSLGKGLDFSLALPRRLAAAPMKKARAASVVLALVILALTAVRGVNMNIKYTRRTSSGGGVESQRRERELARRLEEMLPEHRPLMCMQPWIAVWADLDWRVVPLGPTRRVLLYAQNRGIEYVVLQRWQMIWPEDDPAPPPHTVTEIDVGGTYYLLDLSRPREAPREGAAPD